MLDKRFPNRIARLVRQLAILGIGLLAACSSGESSSSSLPTRTVPPFTPTPTITPPASTPTPTELPGPANLAPTATLAERESLLPPAAEHLLALTHDDLIANHNADPDDIRLLALERFAWRDDSWGCAGHEGERRGLTRGFRIIYSAHNRVYVYHTDGDERFFLCDDPAWMRLEGEPLPPDPIADSMVELAAADAAQRFGVPADAVTLISLIAVIWPDSSLGCPRPDMTYTTREVNGYRLVFRVNDTPIIYHTSIRDFVLCGPEEELLPGLLRRALAEAAAEATAEPGG